MVAIDTAAKLLRVNPVGQLRKNRFSSGHGASLAWLVLGQMPKRTLNRSHHLLCASHLHLATYNRRHSPRPDGSDVTFTFSVPAWTNNGYSSIANLALNAPTYGYNNQSWSLASEEGNTSANSAGGPPQFDFYDGVAMQTQIVTYNYSNVLAAIKAGGEGYLQMTLQGNQGGGAPAYFYLNNVVLSTGPFGANAAAPPPPPPTLGIFKTTAALRMFTGSQTVYARQELATQDGNQSWIGGGYPVQYSFTIIGDDGQDVNFQTQIFLVPVNTIPGGPSGTGAGSGEYNNGYVEYQAWNNLWLQIIGTTGSPTVTANVSWKTNSTNANPNITALSITNSTILGTWTLAFSSPSQGTLTAPGASPVSFTIADPNVSTDFANPMVAYFGVEANATSAEGLYHDYSQISITGVQDGPEVDNFAADTSLNTSLWQINPNSASSSILLVTPSTTPYWVDWTLPATGYGLGVSPVVNPANPYGDMTADTNAYVLPGGYSGYYDAPITNIEGNKIWALIPSDCLPSETSPSLSNAFFRLFNPPPLN